MSRLDPWRYALASVPGTAHQKSGTGCQDASSARLLALSGGGQALVLAVADGAGSARFGDQGAELCCRIFPEEIAARLGGKTGISAQTLQETDAKAICERMREEIARTARSLAEADGSKKPRPRDFACTFLGAVIDAEGAAFLQVGDGAIVIGTTDEETDYRPVFWPHSGEYANVTDFVTDAELRLQFSVTEARIEEIALFSDGLQRLILRIRERAAHAPFFRDMFAQLREKAKTEGLSRPLSAALARFLGSKTICRRTDDDKTLILATRRPLSQRSPDLVETAASTPETQPEP